jgi:putative glutathione S-transferase
MAATTAAGAPTEPAPVGAAPRDALAEVSKTGAFVRTAAGFRSKIGDPGFEAEAGRYHLYVSLACPWACRCLAALYIKGLDDAIGVSVVHPTWQRTRPGAEGDAHAGWAFVAPGDPPLSSSTGYGSFPCDGRCVPDTVNGARFVRDLYELAGDATGKYSVPVLWDKKRRTIVSNESSEIVRMLNAVRARVCVCVRVRLPCLTFLALTAAAALSANPHGASHLTPKQPPSLKSTNQ